MLTIDGRMKRKMGICSIKCFASVCGSLERVVSKDNAFYWQSTYIPTLTYGYPVWDMDHDQKNTIPTTSSPGGFPRRISKEGNSRAKLELEGIMYLLWPENTLGSPRSWKVLLGEVCLSSHHGPVAYSIWPQTSGRK